jgi:hypothetical protein
MNSIVDLLPSLVLCSAGVSLTIIACLIAVERVVMPESRLVARLAQRSAAVKAGPAQLDAEHVAEFMRPAANSKAVAA